MIKDLPKALKRGREIMRRHERYQITMGDIRAIALNNNQHTYSSLIDGFVIGFLQGYKAKTGGKTK